MGTRYPTVTAVIPALNEAENLPHVLPQLYSWVDEVVLVDGNSTDSTVRVAQEILPDIRVITQTGRGKGDALKAGFEAASCEVIVMLDADGSTDPSEIPFFVWHLMDGADFAKGSRYMEGGGSADLTYIRRLGNLVLTKTVNTLFNVQYTDLCYGYMAFWTEDLRKLDLDCNGFEVETLLTLRAAKADMRVVEVPSYEAERINGESNLRPVRDGLRVLRTIMQERSR